jgi:quinoprotein glucose dehydrogenase
LIFIAATADEKLRAFEKHSGRLLWEFQLPAGGYATPGIFMIDGRQYVVIAAGGGGKNATKTGDSILAFALPEATERAPASRSLIARQTPPASADGWIDLFDGKTLNGWVHLNGSHTYTVEDGAIVGRTVPGSVNSFLCSLEEFADFEFEVETTVDRVTNQGIQFRSGVKPMATGGRGAESAAGRVYGPQAEIRRYYKGQPTTGVLYGEALGTGWLSSKEKTEQGHQHFFDEGWNKLRIVAQGPRLQTWVNGQPIEDLVNERVYQMCPKGFIALQIHGINSKEPLVMKWRNIRIRPLPSP